MDQDEIEIKIAGQEPGAEAETGPEIREVPASEGGDEEEKKKDKGGIVHWLWIGGLFAIGIILMLRGCGAKPEGDAQFNLPPIDLNAERVETDPGARNYVEITATDTVKINSAAKTADLYFVNPEASSCDVVLDLKIRIDGELRTIGTSGRLTPGLLLESMENLDLTGIEPGRYEGALSAQSYDAVTGERAMIVTEIAVTVEIS